MLLPLALRPKWQQWGLLLILSLLFLSLLEQSHIPAALMLGPMLAGIMIGCLRGAILIPRPLFQGAQTIVGCMIAASISPQVIQIFFAHWWLFLIIILSAVFVSGLTGYLLARFRIIEGTTAVWGSTPGAAATMVIMSEEFGADVRMVAFMQYLRVLLTTFAASLVAILALPEITTNAANQVAIDLTYWFPTIQPFAFGCTLTLAVVSAVLVYTLHIPAGYIFVPLFLGGILRGLGWIELQLPEWLLAISYACLGWRIGLSFDVGSLRRAYKVLPHVLGATLFLMLFCGFLSWILMVFFNIDPLTAYLATSPGGLDTIAVIVASSPHTDMSFIMTLQVARLLILNVICPPLAKALSKYNKTHLPPQTFKL